MASEQSIFELVKRHPEAVAKAETWAEFCEFSGSTWASDIAWAERILLTYKHNPHGCTRGLFFPKARTFADLFEAACFVPAYAAEPSREHGAPSLVVPGFYGIYDRGMKETPRPVVSGSYGGGRYVKVFSDQTVCRGVSGKSKFYVTRVKPKAEIFETVEPAMISEIGSFEAVTWASGAILITARDNHGIGSRWLAVLDPGENADSLIPADQLEFRNKHDAQELEDFSCIYRGEDGREYVNRDACKIEIRLA